MTDTELLDWFDRYYAIKPGVHGDILLSQAPGQSFRATLHARYAAVKAAAAERKAAVEAGLDVSEWW